MLLIYGFGKCINYVLQLDNGELKFSFRVGFNLPISMSIPGAFVVDGAWHVLKLVSQNRALNCYIDGKKMGDELDSSSAHDFLDPYLTVINLGGFSEVNIPSNKIYNGKNLCNLLRTRTYKNVHQSSFGV
jgi:hypothetical protein